MKLGWIAALCGAAAFGLASAAGAVPLGKSMNGVVDADTGMIQLIHGCHRAVRSDRLGWHYHVGRRCDRVDTAGPGPVVVPAPLIVPRPGPRCHWLGLVWVCD